MTSLLIGAATRDELETWGLDAAEPMEEGRLWRLQGEGGILLAVTGTGIPTTLLRLLPLLERVRPARLLNIGIAGAYSGSALEVGDVVLGESEVFADLGMEIPDSEGFRPLGSFPFADAGLHEALPLVIPAWARGLKRARGATVNTCAGTDATGARRRALFGADFESMEGAAFALAGREYGIPVTEIRSISNHAARRDMRSENVRRALDSLSTFLDAHRHGLTEDA